jgi:hypothetical protein
LEELKKMFGNYQSGRYHPLVATKPGFTHVVNPVYKPPKGTTPKQWEEQQKIIKMNLEAKKKKKPFLYECPDCLKPMHKLGYCNTHQKWATLIPVKESK